MNFFSRLAILMLLLLTGCGFHLRGRMEMPKWLNNVAIIIEKVNPEWESLLKNQLTAYNIKVNNDPNQANYWLFINKDRIQQNIAGISSSTTPRQYQLIYTVWFKIQRAKAPSSPSFSQITVTRQATINSDRILGSTNEEEQLKSEMRREASLQLLYRLSRQTPPPDFKPELTSNAN